MGEALPSTSQDSWREGRCPRCKKYSSSFFLEWGQWVCRHCATSEPLTESVPFMIAKEYLTPVVPNASPGHLRDIEDRRWHPTEKRLFYYSKEKPKTYVFPK